MSIHAFTVLSAFPFTLLVALGTYVMYSYGLHEMAENTGLEPSMLAWVPLLRLYTLGQLADRYNASEDKNSLCRFILPVLRAVNTALAFSTMITMISTFVTGYNLNGILSVIAALLTAVAALACRIVELLCYYKTFRDYEPEYSVLYLVLCIIGLEWIPLFLCRNNVPVGIAGHCRPRQPRYNVNH